MVPPSGDRRSALLLQRCFDEAGEERMRAGGPGLQLRVSLRADVVGVGVLGELDELH